MGYPRRQTLKSLYPKDYTVSKVKCRFLYSITNNNLAGDWTVNIPANSIIQPNTFSPGGVTTTVEVNGPQGWNKYIYPFWNKVYVGASSCRIRWAQVTNSSGATVNGMWKVILIPQRVPQVTSYTLYEYLYAQPYCKRGFTWNFGTKNYITLKHYASTKKIYGMNSNKLYLDDTFQSNISSSGFSAVSARPWYWVFHAMPINDGATQNTQICEAVVTYYFRAWDRKDQTAE